MPADERLTEGEVAERAGVSSERVRELVELGILAPAEGGFARRDVMRTRAVMRLEALGIDAGALARALASGHLSLGYMEAAVRRHPHSARTFAQTAADLGIPPETLGRLYMAFGVSPPSADEPVREEDHEVLKLMPALFAAGLDERQVLPIARVWGDAARRMAEFLTHYFHATVEERYRARGLGDNAAYEAALREVGLRMGRSGEDLIGWLFRRHTEVFQAEHQLDHVEAALEEAGVRPRAPRALEAAAFADLSGFTRLTEEAGDEAAAQAAVTLAQLVSEVAARHGGTVVKMLGDGVHFHFRDPGDAVRASLEIVRAAPSRGLPPAHVGVEAGPMLYDEGDYFGRTVNLAARIAAVAGAGQVFVGQTLAEGGAQDGFELVEVGTFELKGISRPELLFEAVRPAVS
jgi:class 3 adenylate cyclase